MDSWIHQLIRRAHVHHVKSWNDLRGIDVIINANPSQDCFGHVQLSSELTYLDMDLVRKVGASKALHLLSVEPKWSGHGVWVW